MDDDVLIALRNRMLELEGSCNDVRSIDAGEVGVDEIVAECADPQPDSHPNKRNADIAEFCKLLKAIMGGQYSDFHFHLMHYPASRHTS